MAGQRNARRGLRGQAGQATVEYIVVAVGVLIALVAFEIGGRLYCMNGFKGTLSPDSCSSLPSLFNALLQKTVEDVTFLINLPF